ncbi:MAG: cytochrome c3 family protein [Desulfocapsaceae bacterium]|nr:cytochrome c3 family protein [Desulfocapsaceae bacterium]
MRTKLFVCALCVVGLIFAFSSQALTTGTAPENMELTSSQSSKKPPAVFPHKFHAEAYECGECHHGMADGKATPYVEGMEIKSCESCHNPDVLGGKTKGKYKLDTYKGAAHANCIECHKEIAKEDPSKKKLKSCKICHVKS